MRVMQVMQERAGVTRFHGDVGLAKIGRAMCIALAEGNAVVSIAIDRHRRLLEQQLTVHGVDIVEASGTGTYIPLDALETLSRIIVCGSLDVIRFADVIGAPIDRAAEQHGCVSIFGDLVTLLHAQHEHRGADELESLWRSFMDSRATFVDCR